MAVRVIVDFPVELTDAQVKSIGLRYLSALKNDQWVEKRGQQYVLMEEHYTSHRFDADAKDQDPTRIRLVRAVQELEDAIKAYEEKTNGRRTR